MKRSPIDSKAINKEIKLMRNTYQLEGVQTILEHGISVANHYKSLINTIRGNESDIHHCLFIPNALKPYFEQIKSFNLISDAKMRKYLVFHDIGKPHCIIKDVCG